MRTRRCTLMSVSVSGCARNFVRNPSRPLALTPKVNTCVRLSILSILQYKITVASRLTLRAHDDTETSAATSLRDFWPADPSDSNTSCFQTKHFVLRLDRRCVRLHIRPEQLQPQMPE